jgi:cyclophilin family peptidyl-prolyl cis-trans isomerase/HEAT repeat protein
VPMPRSSRPLPCWSLVLALLAVAPRSLGAQQSAVVEQLAPLLAAEDARDFQPELYHRALVSTDSVVRRVAAIGAGRIGDVAAVPLLVPILLDPDSTVRVATVFGLGLLADSSAVQPLIDRLTGTPALDEESAEEAVTALAKIGGPRVGQFLADIMGGRAPLTAPDRVPLLQRAILESWRLGSDAPVTALLPFLEDSALAVRWRAVYAVARLRAPVAAGRLSLALRDPESVVRAFAARALTRAYVDSAKLAAASIAELLGRAAGDNTPQVRINALRSLADYHDPAMVRYALPLLSDQFPNVQVEAASTLGALGGSEAVAALTRTVGGKGLFAVRRAALVGLARADTAAFARAASGWQSSTDWRARAAAAEGSGIARPGATPWFLGDRDGRVVAAGLQAWGAAVDGPDPALLAAGRRLLAHADAGVRSVAGDIVSRAGDPADLPALTAAYRRAARDSFPDAALAALGGIVAIRNGSAAARSRVDAEFLGGTGRPRDYVIRRWAEDHWPEAEARWGPAYPIETGRTAQDYRDVAARYILAPDSLARPHIIIDTEDRGTIEVELAGPEAPLTVANFTRLVARRYFDGHRWHRVVPNFVIQDGDPRGDGFGGPGTTIRDEINRLRYEGPMLGMALSGPDTGGSQWFINLSPQPHLDGTYTVFGKVVGGLAALVRITQGETIRTIRMH